MLETALYGLRHTLLHVLKLEFLVYNDFWPTVLCKVAPLARCVVCLSVAFCIVAKRHILAKNCLKDQ